MQNLSTEGCFHDYIKYASSNVMGMVGLSCYILADTFFISKGLGADGLAALNLAIPVYSFIHGSGLMIGMGGGIKYSVSKSRNGMEKGNCVFTNALVPAMLFSMVFVILGFFASGAIVRMFGADGAVFGMCKSYLQVILLAAPAFMMNNLMLCFVRNDGAPQLSMAAMLSGSFSNIILDYIFIFPLNMGIFGAVLATSLAPVISMLVLSMFFLKKKNRFHIKKGGISLSVIGGIISSGLPSLVTEASSGIVILVFNKIILNLEGNTGVAAYGVIANISLVVMSVFSGIAQGIQPLISINYGAGNHGNVRSLLRYALSTMLMLSGIIYACVFFGAEQIAGIFNSGQDRHLQDIAVSGLKCYFTGCAFAGFNIILCSYSACVQYSSQAQAISILRGLVVIIPMAFLLASIGGMGGVWFAFPVTEFTVSLVGAIYIVSFNGKRGNYDEKGL